MLTVSCVTMVTHISYQDNQSAHYVQLGMPRVCQPRIPAISANPASSLPLRAVLGVLRVRLDPSLIKQVVCLTCFLVSVSWNNDDITDRR